MNSNRINEIIRAYDLSRAITGDAMLCPYCGNNVWGSTGFCEVCGMQLSQQQQPQQPPPQPQQPANPCVQQQYYPPMMYGAYPGYYQQPHGSPYPSMTGYSTANYVIAAILAVAALTILGSTFLPWIGTSIGGASVTGFKLVTESGGGFFMFRWGGGMFIFTGFWSLLLGTALIIPIIFGFVKRPQNWLYILIGALALAASTTDIIMVYTKMGSSTLSQTGFNVSVSPGIGLWLFLGMSVLTLALGIVGVFFSPKRQGYAGYPGYPA